MSRPPSAERARVHGLLKRYGWNATSFQTLASEFRYWFEGEEACVAYVDTGGCWVAAGAPLAPSERLSEVALAFVAAARAEGRRACFFGTETRFTEGLPFRALHIGEQPVWDPQQWAEVLRGSAGLREQLRRARAKGVTVRELTAEALTEPGTRRGLEALMQHWLDSRPLPPMRFLVQLEPFAFLEDKRCWVAEHQGGQVGLLVAVPVYGRQGWFFENLLRETRAPNGTTELLIEQGMRAAQAQGCSYVTLGLVPLSGPIAIALRVARALGRGLYDFEGLRQFKTKLRPTAWTPIFLSVPAPRRSAIAIYDVLTAFAGRSLAGFGWAALSARPRFLAQLLAVSLVPWTAALLLANPQSWFPSRAVWLGWIAFDVLLIVALSALAHRWRRWLNLTLATCITADAGLTLMEALRFNLPRIHAAPALIAVCVAVLGPSAAAFFLWRASAGAKGSLAVR